MMNQGRTVFAQLISLAPHKAFARCVERYRGNARLRRFSCWDHFLVMAFAQLTYRESLRDIEACLGAIPERLYHMGIRSTVARSTVAESNERRDWRIYADFGQVLISEARDLYAGEPLDLELNQAVYALDSSTIELCLTLFPWARFSKSRAAVKLHTLLDLRGNIPAYACVTPATLSDQRILDVLVPEPGSIYVFDRGYLNFEKLFKLDRARAIFVTRAKKNQKLRRLYSRPVDRTTGLLCDQVVVLEHAATAAKYPQRLRRIRYTDPETGKRLCFLTNDFTLPALTIARLYKARWQVEVFFKWIKQHLRIKAFYGTSENAVKSQIWIAISIYVLVAILRKRLRIEASLYTILQILSVSLFEKIEISQALSPAMSRMSEESTCNQLSFFNL
jgi:hypothetical protein